jgi:hypothetical protein
VVQSYLEKYPESVIIFYDSEFGTPQSYFDTFDIDTNRVLHTPLTNIEELNNSSTISIDDLKTIQTDSNIPKRSRRRPKSDKNTVSLDI